MKRIKPEFIICVWLIYPAKSGIEVMESLFWLVKIKKAGGFVKHRRKGFGVLPRICIFLITGAKNGYKGEQKE
ncbi:MAG TPA: hypothetical protein VK668_02105 [Mucilaginibacter sp.]|nr:hypothetical protein [Mucilaginibacter sp.]